MVSYNGAMPTSPFTRCSTLTDLLLVGITIFDISELDNVRYCFVDFYGMESEREVELMTPLSARTYLEAYYVLDESEDHVKDAGLIPLLKGFERWDLVTSRALKETWPHGEWTDDGSLEANADGPAESSKLVGGHTAAPATNVPREVESKESAGDADARKGTAKTLRDQSMDALLESLVDEAQKVPIVDTNLVAEAELLTDFIPKLRIKLYDRAATLVPSTALLRLLHKALEQDVVVDLRPLKTLTVQHLAELVMSLRNGKMRVLNLSNMPDLSESDLKAILGIEPALSGQSQPSPSSSLLAPRMTGDLSTIVLLETPKISIDFLTENLGNYEICHSDLFRRPLSTEGQWDDPPLHTLEFSAPHTVAQLVWVGITSTQSCDSKLRLSTGQFDWSNMKYSVRPSDAYSRDPSIKYKNFLMDVPLPAGKMIHGLQRLLQYITSIDQYQFEEWPKAAARCFATTSALEDRVGYSVGPLSRILYRDEGRRERGGVERSGKGRPLKQDQWAIVLVHEAFDAKNQESLDKDAQEVKEKSESGEADSTSQSPAHDGKEPKFKPLKRLRYALAKALPESGSSEKQFLVTDVPGYLHHVLGGNDDEATAASPMIGWWKKQISAFEAGGNGYYDDDDIHDVVRKVYSGERVAEDKPRGLDPVDDIMKMIMKAQMGDA